MSEGQFTKSEELFSITSSFRQLKRFINSLPLLKKLFLPSLILSLIAVATPQVFLWLTGIYTTCTDNSACYTSVQGLTLQITPSFLALIFFISVGSRIIAWALFEISGSFATRSFHKKMVAGLGGTRTTFFDENPSGRLINRLVRDYESIRDSGVTRLDDTMQSLLEVIATAVLVAFAHPLGGLAIIPALFVFFMIQLQLSPMLQRLTQLRSARFGEVLHRETDLIEGARVFRIYGAEGPLISRLTSALTNFVQINLLSSQIECWGRFWANTTTSSYLFFGLLAVGLGIHAMTISAVVGALIVTSLFRLTPMCMWLWWSSTFFLESLGVIRRAFAIADLKSEAEEERADKHPQILNSQPQDASIEFINFKMSYRSDTPIILDDISVKIPSGTRVGVVGRTGAGKTSIVQSLFRMVYVHQGDIKVGGTSIFSLDINRARNLFCIVPQDPYLFTGTIRSNLSRDASISESKLQGVLDQLGLSLQLDQKVEEAGRNFSFGERQLICLGRALLQDAPIIILDEPTSGVDTITDQRMQNIILNALPGKTIIAIAHRLETLRSYDLILQLDEGRIARVGSVDSILPHITKADVA